MPSHHIAARPWLNVVWHSFQLKPTEPGGAHSRMIFWYHFAASIAAGVSVSSVLPSGVIVSWSQPSRMLSYSTTLAFFRPRPVKP